MASSRVFAAYVTKELPTDNDVESVLDALRPILRLRMRLRGVLGRSPGTWGYAGETWRDPETLNDLLHDCFVYVFTGNRKIRLAAYADDDREIDAAVSRAVRNFLNELVKRKDPLDHRVYKNVQAAVAQAIAAQTLVVVNGDDDSVESGTAVAAHPRASLGNATALEHAVNNWPERPTLGKDLSRHSPRGIQAAASAVAYLRTNYTQAWQVGELADLLKKALPPHTPRSLGEHSRFEPDKGLAPDRPVEDNDTIEVRTQQTRAAIEALPAQRKVRLRLANQFAWMLDFYKVNGHFPKQTDVARHFGEDRKRVNEDYQRLKPVLEEIWQLNPDT
jgi:hypothetical protein